MAAPSVPGELEKILFDFLPDCIEHTFFYQNINQQKVEQALFLYDDQEALRRILKQEKLAAFVADEAVLPRKSGVSDLPMKNSSALLFSYFHEANIYSSP